jgi:hypothetical protein
MKSQGKCVRNVVPSTYTLVGMLCELESLVRYNTIYLLLRGSAGLTERRGPITYMYHSDPSPPAPFNRAYKLSTLLKFSSICRDASTSGRLWYMPHQRSEHQDHCCEEAVLGRPGGSPVRRFKPLNGLSGHNIRHFSPGTSVILTFDCRGQYGLSLTFLRGVALTILS